MPQLTWLGRDAVVNHHYDVPFHFLDRRYGSGDNMIVHGDNLIALKSLMPKYERRIKLIYIDPPYNTGNEGWVYNDNVNDPTIRKWLGEVVGREGEDFTRHDKWLCMMFPRLRLMEDLLADDGVIFISIDDSEQNYLRDVCNEIFGAHNFVATIVWEKKYSPQNDAKWLSDSHDFILVYAKDKSVWQPNLSEVQQGLVTKTLWLRAEVGDNQEAKRELKTLFGGESVFDTPKPVRLLDKILRLSTDKDSIVLDAFGGSGTTAHAVINLNQSDGGERKFILIESQPYAESIIAERVRRFDPTIEFSFYEIGDRLTSEGC